MLSDPLLRDKMLLCLRNRVTGLKIFLMTCCG